MPANGTLSIGKRMWLLDGRWWISLLITTNIGRRWSNLGTGSFSIVWIRTIDSKTKNNNSRTDAPHPTLILNSILGVEHSKRKKLINDLCRCVSSAILIWMRRQYYINGSATCRSVYLSTSSFVPSVYLCFAWQRAVVEGTYKLTSIRSDS